MLSSAAILGVPPGLRVRIIHVSPVCRVGLGPGAPLIRVFCE